MKLALSKINRQFIPLLLLPLIATAITGIIYGICDRFFVLPETIRTILISIHKGQFLGTKLVPLYVLFMGLGTFLICLVTFIDNSDRLFFASKTSPLLSIIYRPLALILVIPLALCVETGIAFQLGQDWFGLSEPKTASFLRVHGGSYLGNSLGILYTVITGLSLILLTIIGYRMVASSTIQRRQKLPKKLEISTNKEYLSNREAPINEITSLRAKIQLGVIFFSLVLIGILYFGTNKLLASIIIILIIFAVPAYFAVEKLIKTWQQQQKMQTQLYEKEVESITMLKAIPDTMLLVSQDGTCLSYMPAKEAKLFILEGDIINKKITDFLAPEIARQLLKQTHSSLQTGSTCFYSFPISIDAQQQYYEARISPLGKTEVLIMVREIADFKDILTTSEQVFAAEKQFPLPQLLTESELIIFLEEILHHHQEQENYVMLCLAIESLTSDRYNNLALDDRSIEKIMVRIQAYFSSETNSGKLNHCAIALLDRDELIILVKDTPSENIATLIENLNNSLDLFMSQLNSNNGQLLVKFNFSVLEVNYSLDAHSLIDLAKTTLKMAKQKVNVKTFW
jgi:hypothetical protein